MRNLLNIDDEVKIIIPGYLGDGQIVKVNQINTINGELYYTGAYHQVCPDGGEGYDTSIQFKDGQYALINTSCYTASNNAARDLSIKVNLDGIDEVQKQLNNLETQLDGILVKINQIKAYKL